MSWNTGRDYKIGDWIINESADLDEFFGRLDKLRRGRGATVIQFRPQSRNAAQAPPRHGTVLSFAEEKTRIASRPQTEWERIRNAFLKQREDADKRVREGKVVRIREAIAALDAQDLSVELEVKLDIIRRDLEALLRLPPAKPKPRPYVLPGDVRKAILKLIAQPLQAARRSIRRDMLELMDDKLDLLRREFGHDPDDLSDVFLAEIEDEDNI